LLFAGLLFAGLLFAGLFTNEELLRTLFLRVVLDDWLAPMFSSTINADYLLASIVLARITIIARLFLAPTITNVIITRYGNKGLVKH